MAERRTDRNGIVYASSEEVAERVDEIYSLMATGQWKRGVDDKVFAEKYNISITHVHKYTAEAWRRVCFEANNPEQMRPEIAGLLRKNIMAADQRGNFNAVAKIADTWSKVIGARAPERHEHAVIIAQFDSLSTEGKIKWLEERISKLEEAKKALEEKK